MCVLFCVIFPAGRSLTPSRLRREARPVRSMLSLVDGPSQSRSYMSPTTSSMAKTSRSVSSGDSCESLTVLTNTPRAVRHSCVCPSRSASSLELRADRSASSSSSSSSSGSARAALKDFSDAPDDPGVQRRRSSSVLLASVPLLLPLLHSSGLLPLCFSPFSLSSSRPCDSGEFMSHSVIRYGWFCFSCCLTKV